MEDEEDFIYSRVCQGLKYLIIEENIECTGIIFYQCEAS